MEKKAKIKNKFLYALSFGSLFGFLLSLPLVLGLILGLYFDKKLKSFPLFLLLGTILGIYLSFYEMKKLILPFLEKGQNKKGKNGNRNN